MSSPITEEILLAALRGEWAELCQIAKSDLHSHALLAASPQSYRRQFGSKLTTPPPRFSSPAHFFRYLGESVFPHLQSLETCSAVVADALTQLCSDSVVRSEMSFDLALSRATKTRWAELARIFSSAVDSAGLTKVVSPELGVAREAMNGDWEVEVLAALDTGFFHGIDIYGDELLETDAQMQLLVDEARRRSMRCKLHSGEWGSAKKLLRDIERYNPDAIQHGIAAASDPGVLRELAARQIPMHVCPQSNYMLSVIERYEEHPIRAMFDAGVKVTINTDDLAIFGLTLSQEFAKLYEAGMFSAEELEVIRRNGLPP